MKRVLHILLLLLLLSGISWSGTSCSSGKSVRKTKHRKERVHRKRVKRDRKQEHKLQEEYVADRHLSSDRRKLLEESFTWLGTPYKYAGQEKGVCADCSGFVLQVYLTELEIKIPRNSAKQAEFCKRIKAKDVKPGDLVFFTTGSDHDRVTHVGMMLDDVSFIHASSSKGVVVSRMDNPWYSKRFKCYGRVPGVK